MSGNYRHLKLDPKFAVQDQNIDACGMDQLLVTLKISSQASEKGGVPCIIMDRRCFDSIVEYTNNKKGQVDNCEGLKKIRFFPDKVLLETEDGMHEVISNVHLRKIAQFMDKGL